MFFFFFFQAEDGIRDFCLSRGLGDVYKRQAVMKASGLPVLADDSGLMVDSLDGAPGVYSARYGHKNSDAERIDYLLANLKDVPAGSRAAKFVCVITCLWPDGRKIVCLLYTSDAAAE